MNFTKTVVGKHGVKLRLEMHGENITEAEKVRIVREMQTFADRFQSEEEIVEFMGNLEFHDDYENN